MKTKKLTSMKNLFLISVVCVVAFVNTFAQSYKPIEWEIFGISTLIPTSDHGDAMGFNTELRYHINDRFALGLKYQWDFFPMLFNEPVRGLGVDGGSSLTAEYYVWNKRNKRAFIGLGLGAFNNEGTTESGREVGGTGLGIIPRFGYKISIIRITAAYNYTLEEDYPDYFSFGLGLSFGGRFKKNKGE